MRTPLMAFGLSLTLASTALGAEAYVLNCVSKTKGGTCGASMQMTLDLMVEGGSDRGGTAAGSLTLNHLKGCFGQLVKTESTTVQGSITPKIWYGGGVWLDGTLGDDAVELLVYRSAMEDGSVRVSLDRGNGAMVFSCAAVKDLSW